MTTPDQPLPEGVDLEALESLLRDILQRDNALSPSPRTGDCDCISHSRDAEREYETGTCPHQRAREFLATLPELRALRQSNETPIPMVLHCPRCGLQHIDEVDEAKNPGWDNPPHTSHKCLGCGLIWRPADTPTAGVDSVRTVGKSDNPKADCQSNERTEPSVGRLTEQVVVDAMQQAWNQFVADTGCYPDDIIAAHKTEIAFKAGTWAYQVAAILLTAAPAEPSVGWRGIETAPKDGTICLGWMVHPGDDFCPEPFAKPSLIYWDDGCDNPPFERAAGWHADLIGRPTHWQPITGPAPSAKAER